jgi:DNA-binding NarL/FixJ family response regulator
VWLSKPFRIDGAVRCAAQAIRPGPNRLNGTRAHFPTPAYQAQTGAPVIAQVAASGATTPATKAARTPLPPTDREREVATLISQRMSNSDIAEALTLSVRTAEGHIYRACARVDAATSTELAQLITFIRVTTPPPPPLSFPKRVAHYSRRSCASGG